MSGGHVVLLVTILWRLTATRCTAQTTISVVKTGDSGARTGAKKAVADLATEGRSTVGLRGISTGKRFQLGNLPGRNPNHWSGIILGVRNQSYKGFAPVAVLCKLSRTMLHVLSVKEPEISTTVIGFSP